MFGSASRLRYGAVGAVGALATMMTLLVPPTVATATPCTSGFFRTYDYTNHVSAIGINSQITTPRSTDVWGYGVGMPATGDIGLVNYSSGEFVQYGWYVGSATGLPYTSTPRVFFGESVSGGGEVLTAGPNLFWRTSYTFRILKTTAGGYRMSLGGVYQLSNSYTHGSLPTPQMTGETDFLCTRMDALAIRDPTPPVTTLYYATGSPASPTWNVFVDTYLKSADTSLGTYISSSAGGQGSFYGYGGG